MIRDDLDEMLDAIHREGGWRAFAANLITFIAIGVALYGLTVIASGLRP